MVQWEGAYISYPAVVYDAKMKTFSLPHPKSVYGKPRQASIKKRSL